MKMSLFLFVYFENELFPMLRSSSRCRCCLLFTVGVVAVVVVLVAVAAAAVVSIAVTVAVVGCWRCYCCCCWADVECLAESEKYCLKWLSLQVSPCGSGR